MVEGASLLKARADRAFVLAAIVLGAVLGRADLIVSGADVLELLLRFLASGVEIGVMLLGKVAVGALDLVLGRGS